MNAALGKPGRSHTGWLVLACMLAAFLADVGYFSQQLPEHVATHFDLQGRPNGWMPRRQHVTLTSLIGVATPLFVVGIFALVCRMRGWGLNIPNKSYWLDPVREQGTYDFLQRQGFWFAALLVAFHAGPFHALLRANSQTPPALSNSLMVWLTGFFLVALAVWIGVLLLRFRLPRP